MGPRAIIFEGPQIARLAKKLSKNQQKMPITAGLNVDLDPFFELAELMMEMSQGTYGLLKTNN